jgi:hypothetical protein
MDMNAPITEHYTCTPAERLLIKQALYRAAEAEQPVGCRRLYYVLVADESLMNSLSPGARIIKEDKTVQRLTRYLSDMRMEGLKHVDEDPEDSFATNPWIPFEWISDTTREVHRATTYLGLEDRLSRDYFARDFWENQPKRVEIWFEKDGLMGIFQPIQDEFRVPLVPVRGQSLGFIHDCFERIKEAGMPTWIFYFGDSDGFGEEISDNIETKMAAFGVTNVKFERLAIKPEQIKQYHLLTRPPKNRFANKIEAAVDLDAISPKILRELAQKAVLKHFDSTKKPAVLILEARQQKWLTKFLTSGVPLIPRALRVKKKF